MSLSTSDISNTRNSTSRDHLLTEIRSGRRLEKIASSIESFLNNQIERIEKALSACEAAAENDRVVQKIMADFELEKRTWEEEREAEVQRLKKAGEDLIVAWEKLETEQKNWKANR